MKMWESEIINNTIADIIGSKKNQILSSEIKDYGKYPVIDQGQSYIAGYSDAEDKLVKQGLPYIIFGDHTRIIKYVDFPFIIGADGTKVLKPADNYHPKFYYFALLSINIPSRGYNRHFTLLKEKSIPKPPIDIQRKIAAVLSTVQKAIETQAELIARATELKKAMMHKLFTEGTRGEKQKMTEIGLVPESWEVKQIKDIAILKSGGTPNRDKKEYWYNGTIPWVKTGEVNYCFIYKTEEKITKDGLENSSTKIFPEGTLLMAMYGQGITRGKVAILGIEAATNQACVAFFIEDGVTTEYLYFYLQNKYEEIRNLGHGANQKNLSADIIKSFFISFPHKKEQIEIVNFLLAIDNKISLHTRKKQKLEELFRTMLHQLMTAAVRVDNLDIL